MGQGAIKFLAWTATLVLGSNLCFADPLPSQRLSAYQVIGLALNHNVYQSQLKAGEAQTKAEWSAAQNMYTPRFGLRAVASAQHIPSYGVATQGSLGLGVTQPIFLPKAASSRAMAKAQYQQAQLNREQSGDERALAAWKALWAVISARESLKLTQEDLAYYQQKRNLIQTLADVGEATNFQVSQVEMALKNAQLEEKKQQLDVEQSETTLSELTGLVSPEFDFSSEFANQLTLPEGAKIGERAAQQAQIQVDMAKASVLGAMASGAPTVVLSAQYPLIEEGSFAEKSSWSATLSVNLDLNDGGQSAVQKKAAQASLEAAKLAQQQAIQSNQQSFETVIKSAQLAQEGVRLAEENRLLAEKNAKLAQVGYENGATNLNELLTARQGLTKARQGVLASLVSYANSWGQVHLLMGDWRQLVEQE